MILQCRYLSPRFPVIGQARPPLPGSSPGAFSGPRKGRTVLGAAPSTPTPGKPLHGLPMAASGFRVCLSRKSPQPERGQGEPPRRARSQVGASSSVGAKSHKDVAPTGAVKPPCCPPALPFPRGLRASDGRKKGRRVPKSGDGKAKQASRFHSAPPAPTGTPSEPFS
jgi:hypothetical protein